MSVSIHSRNPNNNKNTMSKFSNKRAVASASKQAQRPDIINFACSPAHSQTAKLELTSLVLTSFLKDQFYRTEAATVATINRLLPMVGADYAAKLAVFARNEYGMRSVSHYLAAQIARTVKGASWTRNFYRAVIRRPDDILEILACYIELNGKRGKINNALKRGLGDKLTELSEHAIAKYRKDGAALSMIDAVNICHPKHTVALEKLMKGKLETADTWETAITAAGQVDTAEVTVEDAKDTAWARLLTENKLPYFALLRNLRNIAEQSKESLALACVKLVDEKAIAKSLVLPFRFISAVEAIEASSITAGQKQQIMVALTDAVDLSLSNAPELPGKTLVALDDSGSMTGVWKKASLFAAVIAKRNAADLLCFSTTATYRTVNIRNPVLTIAQNIQFGGGGTNFPAIFQAAQRNGVKYDRVVIISDMQGWIGGNTPALAFKDYCRATKASPKIHSFDLQGYGSMQFPEKDVFCMSGFSEKVFEVMRVVEQDREALVHRVEAVTFSHATTE
jgi:hypothetical protein